MLHAFHGETGEELFAYVPNAIFEKLPAWLIQITAMNSSWMANKPSRTQR